MTAEPEYDFDWCKPHDEWFDGCPKCEDGYPYPHGEDDEADRHWARMRAMDEADPLWDMPTATPTANSGGA